LGGGAGYTHMQYMCATIFKKESIISPASIEIGKNVHFPIIISDDLIFQGSLILHYFLKSNNFSYPGRPRGLHQMADRFFLLSEKSEEENLLKQPLEKNCALLQSSAIIQSGV
jgi:hypothetical protein